MGNGMQLQFPEQIALWLQKASFSASLEGKEAGTMPAKVPSNAFDGRPGRPTDNALSLSDLLYISILYPYLFRYSGKTILYIPEHREIWN